MDARDFALQSVMPTVMVPKFSEFTELSDSGSRVLMASNGVWLEVRREWMYARKMIAQPLPLSLPYGAVTPELHFSFGNLPRVLVNQFIDQARKRLPNECAAWVIWDSRLDIWRMEMLLESSVDADHVDTILPVLGDDEHIVLDIHSHGSSPAFFSPTDDHDDRGECKVAGVVGNIDTNTPTAKFRICANGVFMPYIFPKEVIL